MAEFLSDIQSSDKDVRFAAWRAAGQQDASVIPQLAKIAASSKDGVAKATLEAMTTLTHSVGRTPASDSKRLAVARELVNVGRGSLALPVRAHALRLLSLVGGDESVAPVVQLLTNVDIREEAIFCLERIPGDASAKALTAAYASVAPDFKPRVLAALGHRRIEAGVPHATGAMRAGDKDLAVAGVKAYGRIGKKPATAVQFPPTAGLSAWQTIDYWDSRLRYADAQAAAGNAGEALSVYKLTLQRPEEQFQCAALIGMGKLGTPEAAAAIHPYLKNSNRKVRITAGQVWRRMAGA